MVGSPYGFGWPTFNPVQPTPWSISSYAHGTPGLGIASPFVSPQQQILQLLQTVPQQLQSLQQVTYQQQQQLQQIQQLLAFLPHQLQQALHQIAYFVYQQPFQHAAALQSPGHTPGPFGLTTPGVGISFQTAPFSPQFVPTQQPGQVM